MSGSRLNRRQALYGLASLVATSPCLRAAPGLVGEAPGRITPLAEFASVPEFEPMARRSLSERAFKRIAGGKREALERITFRPRMMVNTKDLDLSLELLGQPMFAPILVGPASRQGEIHNGGELATAEGATAAKATLVTAEHSGAPLAKTIAAAPGAWRQFYPDADVGALIERVQASVEAGATTICLSLGEERRQDMDMPVRYSWDVLERLRDVANVPIVLKGVMQAADATEATERGIASVVVSNHGTGQAEGDTEPVSVLPGIADAVAGRIPILVDGGFRRGTDVLKAIALGATAVLVCRPVLWGLASYGAAGVQKVVEMLQSELAQDMVQIGAVNLAAIRRDHIRIHSR